MFDHFVVTDNCSYSVVKVETVTAREKSSGDMQPIHEALKNLITSIMLAEPPVEEELILVGDLDDDDKVVTHATTFVRVMRPDKKKKRDVPVLLHLDFNFAVPHSTIPSLLDEDTDLLNWRSRFFFYKKIVVFRLQQNYQFDDLKHAQRL